MKAMRYHSYGDSGVLVHEEADRPVAGPGQVVLQVAASAFNPLDVAIRLGVVQQVMPVTFPHIPNYDVAGVVAEVGDGVSGWRPGDRAIGFLSPTEPGGAAEYVAVSAEALVAPPRSVDLVDAAALPSVSLTAWQALFEHAELQAGQSILVNGASGAVGGHAVRLAAQAGAAVTATASPRHLDRVRADGAGRIVDHTATPVPEALAGQRFDVVLNLVRTDPEQTLRLVDRVADGGVFVGTTTPDLEYAGRGVRTAAVFVRNDVDRLADLVARVDDGRLAIEVAERRPVTDLAAIHDAAVAGTLPGKVVLLP
jgi:NADPH:quinone reductase-like Zn-dependent oxidoreductase